MRPKLANLVTLLVLLFGQLVQGQNNDQTTCMTDFEEKEAE